MKIKEKIKMLFVFCSFDVFTNNAQAQDTKGITIKVLS
jgi:hypothetical protein